MGKASRTKRERVKAPTSPPAGAGGTRPSWLLPAAGGAVLAIVVAVVLVLALSGGGSDKPKAISWPPDAQMTGLLKTKAPWPANQDQLPGRLDALGLQELGAEGTVIHIHQHLDIWADGKKVTVPAYVGIGQSFISDLHTHDPRGVLHVESATKQTFYLGQFFGVWGVRLDGRCIGGYCAAGQKKLRAWVNGKPFSGDPRDIELVSHAEIALAYGTAAQQPKSIPSSYKFSAGE